MGRAGEPILVGIGHLQRLVFRVLAMIMWAAPVGAFGAMAAVVGETGWEALKSLAVLMIAFYLTCFIFVFGVLGSILKLAAGVNIFRLFKYLAREFLLILSTSSSESALPRVIAKLEHAGVDRTTVGVVVPTGYSFNLDGTAIYLTMASIFIADALGKPLSIGEQISLLVFMIIASKGAAGVTGAGLATLAGGLASHRPELVEGVGFIVGIDRFMSEARALTNFAGNSVATVLVGHWTQTLNREQLDRTLAGNDPFDERTMLDTDHSEGDRSTSIPGVDDPVEDAAAGGSRSGGRVAQVEAEPRDGGPLCRDAAQLGRRLLVEVLQRERGEPGEEHQLQRVGAAYDVVGDPALLGAEPGHVAGEDRVVDGGQVVAAASSDLHVTDQELGEVEADRSGAEEPVVDQHEVVAALLARRLFGQASPWQATWVIPASSSA